MTAREVLDNGAATIDRTLTDQPGVQARLQAPIGTVYMNLGLYREAEALLKQAVETYRLTAGENAPGTMAALGSLADAHWRRIATACRSPAPDYNRSTHTPRSRDGIVKRIFVGVGFSLFYVSLYPILSGGFVIYLYPPSQPPLAATYILLGILLQGWFCVSRERSAPHPLWPQVVAGIAYAAAISVLPGSLYPS